MAWTMAAIKAAHRQTSGHFFDADAMRFFDSRVLPKVYEGPGGVYFVTSEQFHGSTGSLPRKYTVRRFDPATSDVDTEGAYNDLSRDSAIQRAQECASGEVREQV